MATLDLRHSTVFSRLRGLLEVTRLVRAGEELPELLSAIARTISDSLAFRTVVINLYRREWDDFVVSTVYGSDEAREALLGQIHEVKEWDALLDHRFLRRGAYLVQAGEFDWSEHDSFTPDLPVSDDPAAWHPDDALFTPMRGSDGTLLGIVSVDEPLSGRKPTGAELDVLVAVAEHAALAVQAAQEATRAKANREALVELLAVSTSLNESTETRDLLQRVCQAISDALGFERVAVQLLHHEHARFESVANVGFAEGESDGDPLTADQVDTLLRPEFDVAGCFLLDSDTAQALLPGRRTGYRSKLNGRGPYAWHNHWLFVPLYDRRGGRIGCIWADDPLDRLLPEAERLQILRAFANQATIALEQSAQLEAVQNSNAYLRAVIDASPVAIVDFDFDGRVRSWNREAGEMFGWSADEAIGRVNPTVLDDEREAFLADLERIRDGQTLRDLDLRRLHRDGSLIDVSISAGPVRNGQGEIVGAVALMIDVSGRKRSERALTASEARKDAILRAALDSVVLVDHEGLIVEVNPATEETFGWTRGDALGKPFLEFAVLEDHREDLAAVLSNGNGPLLGARLEIAAIRSDRRSFPAEVTITRVDVPGPLLFAVSLRDVRKLHHREEQLREAEVKYRTLVENIPLATYVNDAGMPARTTYISPQVETMLGHSVEAWLEPEFFLTVLHPEDRERVLAAISRTHASGDDFREEYRMIAADGRVVWVFDHTVVVRDTEYRPLFRQGFFVDVTEQHQSESALQQSAELHRIVIAASRDLISIVESDGTLRSVSPSVERILGFGAEELLGEQHDVVVHAADTALVTAYLRQRLAGAELPPLRARAQHRDGTLVPFEGNAYVLEGTSDRPSALVTIYRPL